MQLFCSPEKKHRQLVSFVNDFHGTQAESGKVELIRETMSEGDSSEIHDGDADFEWKRNEER